MIRHVTCIIVGLLMLAGSAHMNTLAMGGYGTHHGLVMPLVAAGVAIAALSVGMIWAQGRRMLAAGMVVAIVIAEAWGFIATAERLVVAREAVQAEARKNAERLEAAKRRAAAADEALRAAPATSKELESALRVRTAANDAATQNSSKPGCRENCRQLLQAQVDAAEAEVGRVRKALDEARSRARREFEIAQSELAAIPSVSAVTPLADRLGVPGWLADLVTSAMGSVALNALACCLLAAGAHSRAHSIDASVSGDVARTVQPAALLAPRGIGKPARFAAECLRPAPDRSILLTDVQKAYGRWCTEQNLDPVTDVLLARNLSQLFEKAAVPVHQVDGKLSAVGISVRIN